MKIFLKSFFNRIYINIHRGFWRRVYIKQYKNIAKRNNIDISTAVVGEELYLDKWRRLDKKVSPIYYRLFSNYIGYDPNIIPEDITHTIIEEILNPRDYRAYYSDKNMFDKIFPKEFLPKTLLRNINGLFYDLNYLNLEIKEDNLFEYIIGYDKIVIKPTINTGSGHGVRVFKKQQNGTNYFDVINEDVLSFSYLQNKYEKNFIIQEYIEQHNSISYFNASSINTFRVHLYRSVINGKPHIPCIILRIGAVDSVLDNAHQGGAFVGVNNNGELSNSVFNQYGEKLYVFNGIDFKQGHSIGQFDKILSFSKQVGEFVYHHKCLGLDIMLDKNGCPRLIEINIDGFGMWAFQFSIGTMFGEYTDEVIEYCAKNNDMDNKLNYLKRSILY